MALVRLIAATALDLALAAAVAFGGVYLYCWAVAPTPGVGLLHVGQALGLPLRDDSQPTRWGHSVSATFTAVPDDDRALEEWLVALPGVSRVEVRRRTVPPCAQGE